MIYYHLDDVLIRRLMSYRSNEHYIDVITSSYYQYNILLYLLYSFILSISITISSLSMNILTCLIDKVLFFVCV